ncbi:hypothetical protein CDL12_22616 [Handroanthus impetiginosus]|uniref:Uncharacterized protein n=1 Tax=Handroanthus impetiginosus TaxID=429701 RepID=A0A2G9GI24_9LAMI|nr:hypothetical protein CDL12_22616 [Handroanthus impetiginosus]
MRYDGRKSGRQRREVCRSFTCISPWFMFCRWFNGGKSRGSGSRRFVGGNLSRNYESSLSSREDVAAKIGKEASFNLGVGFGLICLIAARRNELRMVELQTKIEKLLQNLQTELQNREKKPVSKPSKSSISSSFSNNGVHETPYAEEHDSVEYSSSHDVRGPEFGISSNRYRREKSLRMDQLEAELEAEFDRLNVQMDEDFCLNSSEQQCSEINVEESAPEWSQETGLEEVIEQQQDFSYDEYYYGVPPRELERKLHELLEQRQQERINELESALEYTIEKLEEKGREISWWTNTARLISEHFPAIIPTLLRLMKQDIHCREPDFEVTERGKSLVIEELHI